MQTVRQYLFYKKYFLLSINNFKLLFHYNLFVSICLQPADEPVKPVNEEPAVSEIPPEHSFAIPLGKSQMHFLIDTKRIFIHKENKKDTICEYIMMLCLQFC